MQAPNLAWELITAFRSSLPPAALPTPPRLQRSRWRARIPYHGVASGWWEVPAPRNPCHRVNQKQPHSNSNREVLLQPLTKSK